MFCACETFDMDNEETVCVDKPTICAPVCSKNEKMKQSSRLIADWKLVLENMLENMLDKYAIIYI